jgi:hypothetical protein
MPQPITITGKAIDFTAARDGVQLNLAVAPTETEPAYLLGIPMSPDEAAQIGGMLIAFAGAIKAAPPSALVAARGLSVVPPNNNGSTGG